jgi:hypothetical protein
MKLHNKERGLTSEAMLIIDNCVRMMYVLYHEEERVIHAVRAVAITAVMDLLHHTDNLAYNPEDCELHPEIALYFCKCLVRNQDEVTSISMMRHAYTENMNQAACNLVLANRLFDHIRKYGTGEQVAAAISVMRDGQRLEWERQVMNLCDITDTNVMEAVLRDAGRSIKVVQPRTESGLRELREQVNKA